MDPHGKLVECQVVTKGPGGKKGRISDRPERPIREAQIFPPQSPRIVTRLFHWLKKSLT